MLSSRRPNLFIVGAQKSGTSALSAWLSEHPQVFMSFPKEPGYLCFSEKGYCYNDGYGKRAPASRYVVTDKSAYEHLFAAAKTQHTVLGEASTWYFAMPGMPEQIASYSQDAKIVLILRNPVDRAYSAWCHARRDKLEPCEDFVSALALEESRGEIEFLLRYHRMGMYSSALAHYRAVFDERHLLVLFYDDLQSDPDDVWNRLCKFLKVDALPRPLRQRSFNKSGEPRSQLIQSLLKSYRFKSFFRAVLPLRLSSWVKGQIDRANLRQFPPIQESVATELKAYYRADIEALMQITGRDLSHWLS